MVKSKKKVLVVDDDRGILEVIKIILEDKGFVVLAEPSARNAEDIIDKDFPDTILIDLWMSGIDGEEVIKKIKSQKTTRDIPIIAISALSDGRERALGAGADDFLAKPFNIDELSLLVEKYTKKIQ